MNEFADEILTIVLCEQQLGAAIDATIVGDQQRAISSAHLV